MTTTTEARILLLKSPHMKGDDVLELQRLLNKRFSAWQIDRHVDTDSDFGKETRQACRDVCHGLGILEAEALKHGVTPELRTKLRHPSRRTADERARGRGAEATAFRAKMRKKFKPGKVTVAPGANLAGRPISSVTLDYIKRMAALIDRDIVVTTGTNHSKFTVNGNVSDHFDGHACDMGMAANGGTIDGPVGDRIMEAALVVAGVPVPQARHDAKIGGLFNFVHDGLKIQCIWKTNIGGNHHDHVHVGARPA
jgi:hypothetical protein